MPIIALFSGSYCREEEVVQIIAGVTGYELLTDQDLIAETSKRFHVDEGKLFSAMTRKASIFNKFTHEKERSLACLKCTLADLLRRDNLLLYWLCGTSAAPGDLPCHANLPHCGYALQNQCGHGQG